MVTVCQLLDSWDFTANHNCFGSWAQLICSQAAAVPHHYPSTAISRTLKLQDNSIMGAQPVEQQLTAEELDTRAALYDACRRDAALFEDLNQPVTVTEVGEIMGSCLLARHLTYKASLVSC